MVDRGKVPLAPNATSTRKKSICSISKSSLRNKIDETQTGLSISQIMGKNPAIRRLNAGRGGGMGVTDSQFRIHGKEVQPGEERRFYGRSE